LAAGRSEGEILDTYPYLERENIQAALTYAGRHGWLSGARAGSAGRMAGAST
jgi:uncharacterized protein (DUF433 family)